MEDLKEILPVPWVAVADQLVDEWFELAPDFIGKERKWIIPRREDTFRALDQLAPADVRVVVFGQDPYPREESAVGIAFYDGMVLQWDQKLSPSFRNIIKAAFINKELLNPTDDVTVLQDCIKLNDLKPPDAWFSELRTSGVLWLNTSLTFSDTDAKVLRQHMQFWAPVVKSILATLLDTKRDLAETGTASPVVFVFWGGHAKKLRALVEELNEALEPPVAVEFVETHHPATVGTKFFDVNTFTEVDRALERLGSTPINWLPTTTGEPASKTSSLTPKKRAPAKKKASTKKATKKAPTKKTSTKKKSPAKKSGTAAKGKGEKRKGSDAGKPTKKKKKN